MHVTMEGIILNNRGCVTEIEKKKKQYLIGGSGKEGVYGGGKI